MARKNDASRLQKAYIRLGVSVSVSFTGSREISFLCGCTATVSSRRPAGIAISIDKLQTCAEFNQDFM